jgi:hypothetical protein
MLENRSTTDPQPATTNMKNSTHYYNQTNPKSQSKPKTQPKTQPPSQLVHKKPTTTTRKKTQPPSCSKQ